MSTTQKEASAKSIVPARYEPQAERPLWQMDLRHKLDLKPGQNDVVRAVLWDAIYKSKTPDEFEDKVAESISALLKAVEKARNA